jgi:hypothetical protein
MILRAGVLAFGVQMLRVSSNSILEVGNAGFRGAACGVGVLGGFERVDVLDNTIRRAVTDLRGEGLDDAWMAIMMLGGGPVDQGEDEHELDRAIEGVLHFAGPVFAAGPSSAFAFQGKAGRIVALAGDRGSVGVRGNVADATGRSPAILGLAAGAACVLGENRVTLATRERSVPVVRAVFGSAAVTANHVRARRGVPSIDLRVNGGPFTVLGNIATGRIRVDGAGLAAPWAALNA